MTSIKSLSPCKVKDIPMVCVCIWAFERMFLFLGGRYWEMGISELDRSSILIFLKNRCSILNNVVCWTRQHSHQQCVRVPFLLSVTPTQVVLGHWDMLTDEKDMLPQYCLDLDFPVISNWALSYMLMGNPCIFYFLENCQFISSPIILGSDFELVVTVLSIYGTTSSVP